MNDAPEAAIVVPVIPEAKPEARANVRELLPARRNAETFEMKFGGLKGKHTITIGYYPDGRVGELFIVGGKSGEQIEAIARDFAVVTSTALQFGAPLSVIEHALTRNSQNEPMSIGGAVIDQLVKMERNTS
jgi:hypothetical protein